MLHKSRTACLSFLVLATLVTTAEAQFHHHHSPYQDPLFNLDGSRRRSVDAVMTNANHSGNLPCQVTSAMTGIQYKVACPPLTNAILKLWVPDGSEVRVNGHATDLQALGGVHKNSRVFSLIGLSADRVSPCEIAVVDFRTGLEYRKSISVHAGGHYEVLYPHGFNAVPESFDIPAAGEPIIYHDGNAQFESFPGSTMVPPHISQEANTVIHQEPIQ